MDVSVVLDLDLSQLRHLVRLGVQNQRAQRGGGVDAGGEPIRVPGMIPPATGPGSANMPLRSNATIGIAVVAIVAEKIVEGAMDFAKKLLQGSKILNSYFGAMGKVFSAAIDILLLPFIPILNLLLMGMMKFVAWLTKPSVLAAIAAGIEKMGDMGRALIEWARTVAAFFNNSWNPSDWDWAGLMSGVVGVLTGVFDWLGTNVPNIVNLIHRAARDGANAFVVDNTPSWFGKAWMGTDKWMLGHQKELKLAATASTGLDAGSRILKSPWVHQRAKNFYKGGQDAAGSLNKISRWNDTAGRATNRALGKTVHVAVDVVTSDPGIAATQVIKILTGEAVAEAVISGRLPHWSGF